MSYFKFVSPTQKKILSVGRVNHIVFERREKYASEGLFKVEHKLYLELTYPM